MLPVGAQFGKIGGTESSGDIGFKNKVRAQLAGRPKTGADSGEAAAEENDRTGMR